MEGFLIQSYALRMVGGISAVALLWLSLRLMSQSVGVDMGKVARDIAADPSCAAVYFGLRFVGACVLLGWALS